MTFTVRDLELILGFGCNMLLIGIAWGANRQVTRALEADVKDMKIAILQMREQLGVILLRATTTRDK
jgi:hypothetical protein